MLRNQKETTMNKALSIVLATLVISAAAAPAGAQGQPGVTRTDLQRHDLSIPGRETVQARIDIAPGAVAKWHRHPGEEVIYVIEGVLEYQLEGQAPVTLRAGEVLFVPSGVAHKARNPGTTNGAELATYIVQKGKPLVAPADDVVESR
jgi:quercetin dioxygenase-like cupin family protein